MSDENEPQRHTADCVLLVLGGACSCGVSDREMRELAERMADDEAADGNFAAAAELKNFAKGGPVTMRGEVGPELLFPQRPEQTYRGSNGLTYRGDPDAPDGPLTPGQVMCRICRLDDRTRAATDPNDLQCHVCRAGAPIRLEKQHRAATTPEPVYTCHVCRIGQYPLVGGTLVAHDHPGTGRCAGSGRVPQPILQHDVAAAVKLIQDNPPRLPEPPIVSQSAIREAFFRDIAASLLDAGETADYRVRDAIREGLLKRGWVPGAQRRADAVDEVIRRG